MPCRTCRRGRLGRDEASSVGSLRCRDREVSLWCERRRVDRLGSAARGFENVEDGTHAARGAHCPFPTLGTEGGDDRLEGRRFELRLGRLLGLDHRLRRALAATFTDGSGNDNVASSPSATITLRPGSPVRIASRSVPSIVATL